MFTVVHELFMTDTAKYADIVLPATSQLEQMDLHKGYGHRFLQFNQPAIAPLGECRSNWSTIKALAAAMRYDDWWLRQSEEDALREVFDATAAYNPLLEGITLDRLMEEGTVPYNFDHVDTVPFRDLNFPTPSGKVELYSQTLADQGHDPLPFWSAPTEFAEQAEDELVLLSGAGHHYVSSSMANVPKLMRLEGEPGLEINPADAAARCIRDGDLVVVDNERGSCMLRAQITEDVRPGVVVSSKGKWAQFAPDERNINWLTSDALGDFGGQSTFHSTLVRVRVASEVDQSPSQREAVPAD